MSCLSSSPPNTFISSSTYLASSSHRHRRHFPQLNCQMAIDGPSIQYENDIDLPFLIEQQQIQHQQFVEPAMSLLNSLTTFYQYERNWVHRTRASLELEYIRDNPIHHPPPSPSTSNANFNNAQRSDSRSISEGNYTYSNTSSLDDPSLNIPLNLKKEEEEEDFDLSALEQQPKHIQRSRMQMPPPPTPSPRPHLPTSRFSQRYQAGIGPPALNSDDSIASNSTNTTSSSSASIPLSSISTSATGPIRTPKRVQGPGPASLAQGFPVPGQGLAGRHPRPLPPPTRWHKRKQTFGLYLGSLAASRPLRSKDFQSSQQQQPNGSSDDSSSSEARDPEPSTQLLELFGALVESRMESCERIARLIRDTSSLNLSPPPVSRPSAMATIPPDPSLIPTSNMSVGVPEQNLNGVAPPPIYNGVPLDVNGIPIQMNGMVEMPVANGFSAVPGAVNGMPLVNGVDIDVNDMNGAVVNDVGMNGTAW